MEEKVVIPFNIVENNELERVRVESVYWEYTRKKRETACERNKIQQIKPKEDRKAAEMA